MIQESAAYCAIPYCTEYLLGATFCQPPAVSQAHPCKRPVKSWNQVFSSHSHKQQHQHQQASFLLSVFRSCLFVPCLPLSCSCARAFFPLFPLNTYLNKKILVFLPTSSPSLPRSTLPGIALPCLALLFDSGSLGCHCHFIHPLGSISYKVLDPNPNLTGLDRVCATLHFCDFLSSSLLFDFLRCF